MCIRDRNTCCDVTWPGSRLRPSATTNQPLGMGKGNRGSFVGVRTIGRRLWSTRACGSRGIGKLVKLSNGISVVDMGVSLIERRRVESSMEAEKGRVDDVFEELLIAVGSHRTGDTGCNPGRRL